MSAVEHSRMLFLCALGFKGNPTRVNACMHMFYFTSVHVQPQCHDNGLTLVLYRNGNEYF